MTKKFFKENQTINITYAKAGLISLMRIDRTNLQAERLWDTLKPLRRINRF